MMANTIESIISGLHSNRLSSKKIDLAFVDSKEDPVWINKLTVASIPCVTMGYTLHANSRLPKDHHNSNLPSNYSHKLNNNNNNNPNNNKQHLFIKKPILEKNLYPMLFQHLSLSYPTESIPHGQEILKSVNHDSLRFSPKDLKLLVAEDNLMNQRYFFFFLHPPCYNLTNIIFNRCSR